MNEEFENDALLRQLASSVQTQNAPPLSVDILAKAMVRKGGLKPYQLGFAGACAAALVCAVALNISTPHQTPSVAPGYANIYEYGPNDTPGMDVARWSTDYFDFVPGTELSTSPGSGEAYKLVQDLSAGDLAARLAEALNVDVSKIGTTKTTPGGPIWFSYQNEDAVAQGPCKKWGISKVPVYKNGNEDAGGSNYRYCQTAAEGIDHTPSLSEAKATAIRVFEAVGAKLSPDDVKVTLSGNGYLGISAIQHIGEYLNPIRWNITWGNTGQIRELDGLSAKLESLGNIPLVSPHDATLRAKDHKTISGDVLSRFATELDIYQENFMGGPPITGGKPLHQTKVTVTDSEQLLAWSTDSKGNFFLVPAYLLSSPKGAVVAVQAALDLNLTK